MKMMMQNIPLTIELPKGKGYLRLWEIENTEVCIRCGLTMYKSQHASNPNTCWRLCGWHNGGDTYCQRCALIVMKGESVLWSYDTVLHRAFPDPDGRLQPEQLISTPFSFGGETYYFRMVTAILEPCMSIRKPDGVTRYYSYRELLELGSEAKRLPENELYRHAITYLKEAINDTPDTP